MRFADIPGHEDVKNRLRDMVDNGRVPHALLLEGPTGTGKFSLARAMAQYIHCTDRRDGDSCGQCDSCRQHEAFNHIDTLFSFPVVKKNGKPTVSDDYASDFHEFITDRPFMDFSHWLKVLGNVNAQPLIYVDEASALIRRLNLTARRSEYKIVVMWLPERLHPAAANKLLKLIEEPSGDTLFILSSDVPAEILPTIYSRVQRVAVRRYADDDIADWLIMRHGVETGAAHSIAALASGDMNKALVTASGDKDASIMLDLYMKLMRLAWKRQVKELRQWAGDIAELGREGQMRFYAYCSRMTRNNFIINLATPGLVAMSDDEAAFSSRFFPYINERNIEDMIAEFDRAANDTATNGNARIIAFDLAVGMIRLLRR